MAAASNVRREKNLVSNEAMSEEESVDYGTIRDYYDRVYHHRAGFEAKVPGHFGRLARRLQPWQGKKLLDVGCGTGAWLRAAADLGAVPAGVDISRVALDTCRRALPEAELHCGPAEILPFADGQFDFVSCLGSLEHFLDPKAALREMVRVAKPDTMFLLLVPNAGFLTRRVGLYSGTQQASVREEVRSLRGWQELFASAGLHVIKRWKDLHVLTLSWITHGPWYLWPLRAAQAPALTIWPLSWQYQVYHLCVLKH
jgi:SAM-dependent methyltransferase